MSTGGKMLVERHFILVTLLVSLVNLHFEKKKTQFLLFSHISQRGEKKRKGWEKERKQKTERRWDVIGIQSIQGEWGCCCRFCLFFSFFFFSCGEGLCSFRNDLPLHPPHSSPSSPHGCSGGRGVRRAGSPVVFRWRRWCLPPWQSGPADWPRGWWSPLRSAALAAAETAPPESGSAGQMPKVKDYGIYRLHSMRPGFWLLRNEYIHTYGCL